MTTKAYRAGHRDGLAWDLDGYESISDVRAAVTGWDDVALGAFGREQCRIDWGLSETATYEEWSAACRAYNLGAYDGATAPQSERTGLPPRPEKEIPYE